MSVTESRETLAGPAGDLQALTARPETVAGVAVICHPHPLYGGTLRNKVVHYLARTLNELNIATVRFNFRGVEQSAGRYDEGRGEQDDCRAAIAWARSWQPDRPLWLAGFSFGAYVALAVARETGPAQLITVAPPVSVFSFEEVELPDAPWLLIQGLEDEVVPAQQVLEWARNCRPQPEIVALEGVSHFFHGRLNLLRQTLLDRLG